MIRRLIRICRRFYKPVSLLILVVSLYYVGTKLFDHFNDLDKTLLGSVRLTSMLVGGILYAFAYTLCGIAWGILVSGLQGEKINIFDGLDVYGRANIAKYLPGNVFHFVGRQVLGGRKGWQQNALALGSVLESILIVIAALIVVFALIEDVDVLQRLGIPGEFLVVASISALVASILFFILQKTGTLRRIIPSFFDAIFDLKPFHLILVVLLYLSFHISTGGLLWLLNLEIMGPAQVNILSITISAFVSGWVLGYLTPAAPGGIGVREAVIIYLLSPDVGDSGALGIALSFRIVTTLGDLYFFAWSLSLGYWRRLRTAN
jgi:glycosyltransferase 2 family protein